MNQTECCGQHAVCERWGQAEAEEPLYYEDEELDRYRGRACSAYEPQEVEEFEEVMTTMRPDEVAGWLHSLELRGVALPDELREQAMMLMEN